MNLIFLALSALGMFEQIITHYSQKKFEVAVEEVVRNYKILYCTYRNWKEF
jgi:hypothetical protein